MLIILKALKHKKLDKIWIEFDQILYKPAHKKAYKLPKDKDRRFQNIINTTILFHI